MADHREDAIRERAHQLWEAEGRPDGRGEQHWAQAAREIGEAQAEAAEGAASGQDEAPVRVDPAAAKPPKPRRAKPAEGSPTSKGRTGRAPKA